MSETNSEQDLCKGCGFCCDGTLFNHGTTKADEVLPPDIEEIFKKGKRCFKLPCPYFNGACTIYHQGRPSICGTFKCTVLKNFIAGEIQFAEATQLIDLIQSQKARIRQLLVAYAGETLSEQYKEFQRQNADRKNTPEFRLQHKNLLTEWALFKMRLKRFRAD